MSLSYATDQGEETEKTRDKNDEGLEAVDMSVSATQEEAASESAIGEAAWRKDGRRRNDPLDDIHESSRRVGKWPEIASGLSGVCFP